MIHSDKVVGCSKPVNVNTIELLEAATDRPFLPPSLWQAKRSFNHALGRSTILQPPGWRGRTTKKKGLPDFQLIKLSRHGVGGHSRHSRIAAGQTFVHFFAICTGQTLRTGDFFFFARLL